MSREPGWQRLKELEPNLLNMILIRLFPKSQWNWDSAKCPWEGHPFVDATANAILREQGRLPPRNLFRDDPEDRSVTYYPTYANWTQIEPAKEVCEWVNRQNEAHRVELGHAGLWAQQRHFDLEDEDYLHNAHRVFQPLDDRPTDGNSRRNIRKAQISRRKRNMDILELFHRVNLYDYPPGPIGDLTQHVAWGAPVLGVPEEDVYVQRLRTKLLTNRQPVVGRR